MTKLAANWQFLLVSQIVKGKFFLRPDIAMSMTEQVADLINGKANISTQKRNIELGFYHMDQSGKPVRKSFYMEDEEDDSEGGYGSPYDDAPKGSVAIIPIKGSMMKYGSWCEYGTKDIASMMLEAANHKNIGSIVLDIDSGGGSVDSVAPITDAIAAIREMNKPVVSSIDLACSAAYWVASATDYLVADNGISAEVGSIGVMMSFYDMKEYYEAKGIKLHTIYADESADKNLAFQKALEGKYEMIKEDELNPLARNFQNIIRKNREGKLDESVKGILSGKVFFAEDALKHGLIDRIGNSMTAINVAIAMSHAKQL